ncbi:DUF5133 domain-containing protein [Kitasatospora sp. KL5]|uniref:DUF5133 domain-containing protein n=1 Tax=Kitasatospora sp. KL5 TaxID=3425125 RepID=UPI003D6F4176
MPLINYVVLGALVAELDALADVAVPDAAVRRRREDALYTVCVYTGVRDPLRALVRARRLLARHDAAVLASPVVRAEPAVPAELAVPAEPVVAA